MQRASVTYPFDHGYLSKPQVESPSSDIQFSITTDCLCIAPRTPAARHFGSVHGQPTGVIECVPQQQLDMRVGAPQPVRCPTSKSIMNRRIDAQEKVLPFGHG
jgi:hypothetical protein